MPRYATARFKAETRRVRREQIEKAALQSVLKHGFPNSSLRIVAKEAKVPLSILHYYFKDKDDLMLAVVKRIFDGTVERLIQVQAREKDALRRTEALLKTYVMLTTENWQATLAVIEYWAASVRKGTVDKFYTQLHFRYRELLGEALREAGAKNPDGHALALLGMMVGYATFYRTKVADPAERERFLEFARAMVRRAVVHGKRGVRIVRR
ncbi:MAG TPA: TetR/AcrR family transcriptional regulator [Candidatus Binataceae bacterium]|nr:TetR/AcrR family transcriptional regulator [Candidatus Binataceae bacterium]